MIEEKRKGEEESSTNLIRKFNRKVKMSGLLRQAKSLRFKQRPVSELKKKKEALKRVKVQKRTEYLKKLGKIK